MNEFPQFIEGSEDLVQTIDELKHRLKARLRIPTREPIVEEFDGVLNTFIKRWGLDSDPHSFATIPKDGLKEPGD